MPLYVYQCTDCGVRFEATQSFHDAPMTTCPECNGSVYRVIGSTGVIFKGSGFYVTDNRKSSGNGNGHRASAKSDDNASTADSKSASEPSSGSSAPSAPTKTDD